MIPGNSSKMYLWSIQRPYRWSWRYPPTQHIHISLIVVTPQCECGIKWCVGVRVLCVLVTCLGCTPAGKDSSSPPPPRAWLGSSCSRCRISIITSVSRCVLGIAIVYHSAGTISWTFHGVDYSARSCPHYTDKGQVIVLSTAAAFAK